MQQKNPFPRPSALQGVLLRELVKCAKACYDRGWSHGTAGNFSLRGSDGIVWQSPSGLNKGELDPEGFIPIDLASSQIIIPVKVKPSAETPVHLGIYRAVPTAMAVVHTHSPCAVAASRLGKDIVFQGDEMQKHLGCRSHTEVCQVPVVKNPTPEEMPAMTVSVAKSVRKGVPMIILATHGVYAWGRTPMEALSYIEALEFLCKTRA